MFTGMVGPYMVLLHPAMSFHGLAGVVALLTLVVVVSGLVGRYLYASVPRVLEGPVLEELPQNREHGPNGVLATRRALATWRTVHVPLTLLLFLVASAHIVGAIYYATFLR
jgi:hypothetical protein